MKNTVLLLFLALISSCNGGEGNSSASKVLVEDPGAEVIHETGVSYSLSSGYYNDNSYGGKISFDCIDNECLVSGEIFQLRYEISDGSKPRLIKFENAVLTKQSNGRYYGEIHQNESPYVRVYNLQLNPNKHFYSFDDGTNCYINSNSSSKDEYDSFFAGSVPPVADYFEIEPLIANTVAFCLQ